MRGGNWNSKASISVVIYKTCTAPYSRVYSIPRTPNACLTAVQVERSLAYKGVVLARICQEEGKDCWVIIFKIASLHIINSTICHSNKEIADGISRTKALQVINRVLDF